MPRCGAGRRGAVGGRAPPAAATRLPAPPIINQVGGVPTPEVNNLELEFLFSVNFSLHVATDVYEKYYSELANHMGLGVPPEASALNTCDCASVAHLMSYHGERSGSARDAAAACPHSARPAPAPAPPAAAAAADDLRHTGMRTTAELAAETMAAYAASHAAAMGDDAEMAAPPGAGSGGAAVAAGGPAAAASSSSAEDAAMAVAAAVRC